MCADPSAPACPDFNPRSPYGERRAVNHHRQMPVNFNPRSPYGERPVSTTSVPQMPGISIHAPLTGSDRDTDTGWGQHQDFNPRSPYGERPRIWHYRRSAESISIHAPLTGSDVNPGIVYGLKNRFQSTLPLRGATRDMLDA